MRRAFTVLLGAGAGGAGYVAYKANTDDEFRTSITAAYPQANKLLDYIPKPPPTTPPTTPSASPKDADPHARPPADAQTAPPEPLADIVLRIEDRGLSAVSDKSSSSLPPPSQSEPNTAPTTDADAAHSKAAEKTVPDLRSAEALRQAEGRGEMPTPQDGGERTEGKSALFRLLGKPELRDDREQRERAADAAPAAPTPTPTPTPTPAPAPAPTPPPALASVARPAPALPAPASVPPAPVPPQQVLAPPRASPVLPGDGELAVTKRGAESAVVPVVQAKPVPVPEPDFSAPVAGRAGSDAAVGVTAELDALRTEIRSQVKWEAVRLQEAVRAQLVEDKKDAARQIASVRDKHAKELTQVRADAQVAAQASADKRIADLMKEHDREREREVVQRVEKREQALRDAVGVEYDERYKALSAVREAGAVEARSRVDAVVSVFDTVVLQTERAKAAARRATGAFLVRQAVMDGAPLRGVLESAIGDSELATVVSKSVDDSAVDNGVWSSDKLKVEFERTARRSLSAAMVPEGKTGWIWAHFLGSVFSRLKVGVDMRAEGDKVPETNEGKIRLAQQLVCDGELRKAVATLDEVNGLAKDVLKDWMGAAKSSISASLAADALMADAIVSQISLASGQ